MNKIFFSFVLCILFLFLLSCNGGADKQNRETRPLVRAAVVKTREIPDEINGFGALSFLKKIDIGAPEDAVLGVLHYREGDTIRRGAVTAELENPQITLALGRAENAYTQSVAAVNLARSRLLEAEFQSEARIKSIEKAEAELEEGRRALQEQERKQADQEILFEAGALSEEVIRSGRFTLESAMVQIQLMEKDMEIKKIGSRNQDLTAAGLEPSEDREEHLRSLILLSTATLRAELQAAEARLEASEKELTSARLMKSELTVRSPAAGIVGARYFEEGERLKKEDKILTLIDTESLYAMFSVREAEARRLARGMPAEVTLDSVDGSFEGTIDLVSPQADSQSFTFPVRVLLPPEALNGSMGVKPGMFARISVTAGPSRTAPVVSENSLMDKQNNEARVFTISGNVLTERKIVIGGSFGEDREIISGLAPGEVVVLRPDSALREGHYVSVSE
ncbi:hypothetical protein AGMMS49928_11820 [Spirochaetia bacterium]|nr:hypothetical protein AGMMS49928_11820 [Spirochaetia bacterium]